MDEITLDDQTYVSSKRAAQITGYAKDYVGQLCREGRVTARLVGRNWYVLETSLREHRFGAEAQAKSGVVDTKEDLANTWKAPSYAAESASSFPTFTNAKPPAKEPAAPMAPIAESSAVQEMQNAWQDWFTKKNDEKPIEEVLLETPAVMDARAEGYQPMEEYEVDPLVEPSIEEVEPEMVHITRVEEEKVPEPLVRGEIIPTFEEEEETVPIHRTYAAPITFTPPSMRRANYANEPIHQEEGRIIRERRIKAKKKPSLVLSALFVAIALVAIAAAAVGSGKFDQYLNQGSVHTPAVQYLDGETNVVKNNK